MEIVVSLVINTILAASVYALIASGLSFIYATTRVFHLAHGAVIAFSAYVFWWLSAQAGWSLVLAMVGGCASAVVLGVLMNELVYEPLRRRKTKGLGYLMATIALLMIVNAAILPLFGPQTQSLGVRTEVVSIMGAPVSYLQMVLIVTAAGCLGLLVWIAKKTRFGKAMRATADNEIVAEVLGINTVMIRRLTFAFGSFLGGVAGILFALEFNLTPNMGVLLALKGFAVMVMGGVGSTVGSVFGSLILGGVEQLAVFFWSLSWRDAVAFILLFLTLLIRPQGMFGRKRFF